MEAKNTFKHKFNTFFLRVALSEKILFTKHLSMMISSGMTEVDSVRLIRKQADTKSFATILDAVIKDLEGGQFLSTSLSQFPSAFSKTFTSLISMGEVSGTLPENLNYLSSELKKSSQLRSKVRSALIYPLVILGATLGITGLLVFFIMPKLTPVFASLNVELPFETRALLGASDFFLHNYGWVIGGAVALFVGFSALLSIPSVKYAYHRTLIGLPLVGKIAVNYNMANITRTLGIFLKSGIKIVEAVTLAADSVDNKVYQRALLATAEEIKKGGPLSRYLEAHPKIFPPTVSRMIEVGENTGKLDDNLFYLADFYENEVDDITKNLSSIIEPVMLLFMGGLVGFVVISIIKPIYGVTQNLTH